MRQVNHFRHAMQDLEAQKHGRRKTPIKKRGAGGWDPDGDNDRAVASDSSSSSSSDDDGGRPQASARIDLACLICKIFAWLCAVLALALFFVSPKLFFTPCQGSRGCCFCLQASSDECCAQEYECGCSEACCSG